MITTNSEAKAPAATVISVTPKAEGGVLAWWDDGQRLCKERDADTMGKASSFSQPVSDLSSQQDDYIVPATTHMPSSSTPYALTTGNPTFAWMDAVVPLLQHLVVKCISLVCDLQDFLLSPKRQGFDPSGIISPGRFHVSQSMAGHGTDDLISQPTDFWFAKKTSTLCRDKNEQESYLVVKTTAKGSVFECSRCEWQSSHHLDMSYPRISVNCLAAITRCHVQTTTGRDEYICCIGDCKGSSTCRPFDTYEIEEHIRLVHQWWTEPWGKHKYSTYQLEQIVVRGKGLIEICNDIRGNTVAERAQLVKR